MHLARPTLLIPLLLVALTLIYSGRWADTDPRAEQQMQEIQLADTGEALQ